MKIKAWQAVVIAVLYAATFFVAGLVCRIDAAFDEGYKECAADVKTLIRKGVLAVEASPTDEQRVPAVQIVGVAGEGRECAEDVCGER